MKRSPRPIFVVGSGRSGTTLLYELLCGHPDLAWFSNYTSGYPRMPALAILNNVYPRLRDAGIGVGHGPIPTEGYPLWDRVRQPPHPRSGGPLDEQDATETEIMEANRLVEAHLRFQRKPRFVNKNTRNVIRMRYLRAIFDDARFIHIVRDPRAVVASTLRVAWWPDLPVWCFGETTPAEWAKRGKDTTTMAARLWKEEVNRALVDRERLPRDAYLELRYEHFVERPIEVLREVLDFVELPGHPRVYRWAKQAVVRDANTRNIRSLTPEQLAVIENEVGGLATRLEYPVSS